MKKKLSVLFFIASLVFTLTTILAVEGIGGISALQRLAVESSRRATLGDLEIKAYEGALEDAKQDADFQMIPGTKIDMYNSKIKKEVAPFEAEANLEYAKRNKEKTLDSLKFDVYKAALGKVLGEKKLDLESKKLEILNEKYEMSKARLKEGKITENDLKDVEYSLNIKKADQDKAKRDLEILGLELKKLLNMDFDAEDVLVEDSLELTEWTDIDIEKAIGQASENNIEVFKKTMQLQAQKKTMDIAQAYYNEGNFSYDDNRAGLEMAEIELEDEKARLEVSIRNKYNDLLTGKDNLELSAKWSEIQKNKFEAGKARYDKGLLGRENVLDLKEQYLDAQYQRFAAIYDFNILKAELDILCK